MAEKKSTTGKAKPAPRKRAAKKLEELKPASEVKPAGEQAKPRETNWDVIGFSSAAVTLFGAGLLFMLGWAYEVNWYGYFGVSMTEVATQPQNIFIQSIPGITTLIAGLTFSATFQIIFIEVVTDKNKQNISKIGLRFNDWLVILAVSVFVLVGLVISYIFKLRDKINNVSQIYEIAYLLLLLGAILIPLLYSVLLFIVEYNRTIRKEGLNSAVLSFAQRIRYPQRFFVVALFMFILILSTISLSALYAMNDAAKGIRGSGGWSIQPMSLVSSKKFFFPDSIIQTCDDSFCNSGPFGLIGENDNTYILIKWKEDHVQYFPYHPGIFIIPKSENTYLIPFTNLPISSPSSQVSPTPTATVGVKPSFTPTIMPTLRPTLTPTFTPIPGQP